MAADALHARLTAALTRHQRGEFAAARASYMAILADHPRCFDAMHLLGILDADTGALDRGIALLRAALAVDPERAQAHCSLATALLKKGDAGAALSSVERALALQPAMAEAWFLRGNLLQQAERPLDAAESYARAIRLRPAYPEAFNNLAAAQRTLRQLTNAYDSANRALALRPGYPMALNNRGLIALDGGRAAAAVADFRAALAIDAGFAEAWHNLGTALMQLRQFGAAADAFARLARVAPGFRHVQGNLLFARLCGCDWSEFAAASASVVDAVTRGEHAALPAAFLSVCDAPELQLRCAQLYTAAYFPARPPGSPGRPPASRDRIRVAYLSGDFGAHAISYLLAGVLERHDADRFDIIAVAWDRRATTAPRRRMGSAFSRFIDVTDKADAEVARLMRELEVDIAVDLMGHTLGQRTGILAHRPAPVQVNYLGLPATMGAPYIDYLIVDRHIAPPDRAAHYAERLVRMPRSFQPTDDSRVLPAGGRTRGDAGLPADALVFCSFNRNHKFNPACFDVWSRLLHEVPDSVLWLLASESATADNLRREAARRNIDPARLVFAADAPYDEYLARYLHADLFLDTTPFNGGATVSDAVSMGLPVLTCAGESFASRGAGGILRALDLPELVTHSLEDYFRRAMELATDRTRLGELRRILLQRRADGAGYFDTDGYRRALEAAYAAMWERHAGGLPPDDVTIPPPA